MKLYKSCHHFFFLFRVGPQKRKPKVMFMPLWIVNGKGRRKVNMSYRKLFSLGSTIAKIWILRIKAAMLKVSLQMGGL